MSADLTDLVAPACVALRRLADDAEAAPAARHAHVGETIAESRRQALGALRRLSEALGARGCCEDVRADSQGWTIVVERPDRGVAAKCRRWASDWERWAEGQAKDV